MNLAFPSREFDDAVAGVCHGTASEEQMRGLNLLLRHDAAARDEYLLRLELHSRLLSEPDWFASVDDESPSPSEPNLLPFPPRPAAKRAGWHWVLALAASVALLATGWWGSRLIQSTQRNGATSRAVALLERVVEAQWNPREEAPRLGAPLPPGWLRLKSGLAQIVFYSGARVAIEGPIELQLVSSSEVTCPSGRLVAEVPVQAIGFRVRTPEMKVTDLGTVFGVAVTGGQTELHVFKGSVDFQAFPGTPQQNLVEGRGAIAQGAQAPRLMAANPAGFTSLFELQEKSSAAEVVRYEHWLAASRELDHDPSLLVHFDFEPGNSANWSLPNTSRRKNTAPDATIVGCPWVEGRWPDKRALEFRGVSDRVRLNVPGDYESLTLAAWVRVQGLDRQINSLFMSDGFAPGTLHWSVRSDGVLGLTAIGAAAGQYQICASPPVLTLDQFGLWVHLAVVIDGPAQRVTHYLNGIPVGEVALKLKPPFRIGLAQLGNWNTQEFPRNDPFMIRNFSGAMDEFCLFQRALNTDEIRTLYSVGKPQPDLLRQGRN